MYLKEYIEVLKKLEKKHGNIPVITSSDDEGNSFHPVMFHPSAVYVEDLDHYIPDVYDKDDLEDGKEYVKVICLN